MLDGVRRRLPDDEIGGGFDLGRQPPGSVDREVDWDGRPLREHAERCFEAALGQLGRMNAVGESAEFLYGIFEIGKGGPDKTAGLSRMVPDRVPRVRQLQSDRDELLLGTVVEVSLD